MALKLGRLGLATSEGGDNYTIDDPLTIAAQGDTLTLTGLHVGTSAADVLWLRDQLLLMADSDRDELVIPCRFGRSELDGWYEVLGTSVNDPAGAIGGATSWFDWAASLRRVREWRYPRHDQHIVGSVMANGHGRTSGTIFTCAPGQAEEWATGYNSSLAIRYVSDGNTAVNLAYFSGASSPTNVVSSYAVPVAGHYHGCCRVFTQIAGANRSIVGRWSTSTPTTVVISNGAVRCQWVNVGTQLQVEWWDTTSAAWESATPIYFTGRGAHGDLYCRSASVRRNSPEQVTVRFTCTTSGGLSWGRVFVDVTLRRGSRFVTIHITSTAQAQWQASFASATACTAAAGGIYRTIGDGWNHRPMLLGADAGTVGFRDVAGGAIWQSTTTNSCLFGLGLNWNTSASFPDDVVTQLNEWFYQVTETQRTVTV